MPRKTAKNDGGSSNPKPNSSAPIGRETRSQARQRQLLADELAREKAAEEARRRALQSSSDSPAHRLNSQSPNTSSLADGHRRSVALGAASSQGGVPPEDSGPSSRRPQVMARKNFTKIRGEFRGRVPPINVIMEKRGGGGAARHAAAIRGTISGTERTSQPSLPSNANGSVLNEAETRKAGPVVDVCSGATRENQSNDLDNGCIPAMTMLTNDPTDIPTMEMDMEPTPLGQWSTSAADTAPHPSLEAETSNLNTSRQKQLEGVEGMKKAQDGATSIVQTEDLEIVNNMMIAMIKEVSMKTSIGEQEALLVNPELSADEPNNKRKTVASPQEPAKKNRPESIDTSSGKFVCFIFSSEKSTPKAFDEIMKGLELVHLNNRNKFIHIRASSVCVDSHLWGVEFLACDQLAERLNWLLNHSKRPEEMDRLNESSFGTDTSKHLHFTGPLDKHDFVKVTFLLLLQGIIGHARCCVDGFELIAQFGKRFTLEDVIKKYPEPAAKALSCMNRRAKDILRKTVGADVIQQLQPHLGLDTSAKLHAVYEKLNAPESAPCSSLLKKHLTKEIIDLLKTRKTDKGLTLYNCIQSGEANLDETIGVYAPSQDAYSRFAPFFNGIIASLHGFGNLQEQPAVDFGEDCHFPQLDIEGRYILSSRIRCTRNFKGFPLNQTLTRNQYLHIEGILRKSVAKFEDLDLRGNYFTMNNQMPAGEKQLVTTHILHQDRLKNLRAAGATNFWPSGRGLFRNADSTFQIYVNYEDHLRLVSIENGSDVGSVWKRMTNGLRELGREISFQRDQRLGWFAASPSNLGTGLRASVIIRLPHLTIRQNVNSICASLNLHVRKMTRGEAEDVACTYILRNTRVLGVTEVESVQEFHKGVQQILQMEKDCT